MPRGDVVKPHSMNRSALITRVVVTGVPMIALVVMILKDDARNQAALEFVYCFLAAIVWIVGALAGRIVGWLTRGSARQ